MAHIIKRGVEALAEHLGCDIEDVKEHVYQPTQGLTNVYSIGNDYLCAVKEKGRLPKHGHDTNSLWNWEEVPSYVNQFDWKIFKHKEE